MDRQEAERLCQERNAQARDGSHWFVKQVGPEDFQAVCVEVPGAHVRGALHETAEVRPEPQTPPDLRSSLSRDLPAYNP